MRKPPEDSTLRHHFAWMYGRLHMAREALENGAARYEDDDRLYWRAGQRFRKGYLEGTISMSTPLREERVKMQRGTTCCYCGASATRIQMEHVFPKSRGGTDAGDNLLPACRSCNSSKGGKDVVLWILAQGRFPPIVVVSRYLKLAAAWCDAHDLMSLRWIAVRDAGWPFDKRSLRVRWPNHPGDHHLWPEPV